MKKFTHVFLLVFILFVWEIVVKIQNIPLYVLPPPTKVITAFINDFENLINHASVTVFEAILGVFISIFLAILIGILMDLFESVKKAIYPLLIVTQTVPVIVLTPLFIIYLGFGILPKIVIVVLMCFFPICINFSNALENVDESFINLAKFYGASKYKIYKVIKIPATIPQILSGIKISVTYSIGGAVVGEWIGAKSGLGYYLLRLNKAYMLDRVFACVLMIILISLVLQIIVFKTEKNITICRK